MVKKCETEIEKIIIEKDFMQSDQKTIRKGGREEVDVSQSEKEETSELKSSGLDFEIGEIHNLRSMEVDVPLGYGELKFSNVQMKSDSELREKSPFKMEALSNEFTLSGKEEDRMMKKKNLTIECKNLEVNEEVLIGPSSERGDLTKKRKKKPVSARNERSKDLLFKKNEGQPSSKSRTRKIKSPSNVLLTKGYYGKIQTKNSRMKSLRSSQNLSKNLSVLKNYKTSGNSMFLSFRRNSDSNQRLNTKLNSSKFKKSSFREPKKKNQAIFQKKHKRHFLSDQKKSKGQSFAISQLSKRKRNLNDSSSILKGRSSSFRKRNSISSHKEKNRKRLQNLVKKRKEKEKSNKWLSNSKIEGIGKMKKMKILKTAKKREWNDQNRSERSKSKKRMKPKSISKQMMNMSPFTQNSISNASEVADLPNKADISRENMDYLNNRKKSTPCSLNLAKVLKKPKKNYNFGQRKHSQQYGSGSKNVALNLQKLRSYLKK